MAFYVWQDGTGWVSLSSLPPSGAAGGDLTGTYPNPTVHDVSILTTKGDLLVRGGSAPAARLPVGSDTQVLTADSTQTNGVKWAASAGGPPTGAAGGDLTGTYPNPTLGTSGVTAATYGDASHVAQVTFDAKGRATSASNVAISAGTGSEINYTQITTTANVTDTSEATATALISPGAITFDGQPVLVQTFVTMILGTATNTTDLITVSLFEGATQITRLGVFTFQDLASSQQFQLSLTFLYRFTPTAGSHTYKVTAFTNSTTGTPRILAGSGGTAGYPPSFVRFTKV